MPAANRLRLVHCRTLADREQAVDLLVQAFAQDPAMVHFVGDASDAAHCRRCVITALVAAHHHAGAPIYLLLDGDRPIGAALVEPVTAPFRELWGVLRSWRQWRRLGWARIRRLNRYRSVSRMGVDPAACYLSMIGVQPGHQGRGIGRQFLVQLQQNVAAPMGWALDTENAENVLIYEKLGYRLMGRQQIGDLRIYQMHRPA